MCQEPVDSQWVFVGPFDSGQAVVLEFTPTYETYPPGIDISGSFPTWDAWFEDGYDQDFNDFHLRIFADTSTTFHVDSVACSPNPVVRGSDVDCRVAWLPVTVSADSVSFEWQFQSDSVRVFPAPDAQGFPPLDADSAGQGLKVWSGPAVLGGLVSVRATWQGAVDSATTTLAVTPRTGASWGNLPVSLAPDTLDIPTDSTVTLQNQPSPFMGDSTLGLAGLNLDSIAIFGPEIDKMIRGEVELSGDGVTVPTGPNRGFAYFVGPGALRATRRVAIRTWVSGNEMPKFDYDRQPGTVLTNRGLLEAINSKAHGPQRRFGADSVGLLTGVFAHETNGANGGKGHQGQIELAAASLPTCGKVPYIVEGIVAASESDGEMVASIVLAEGRKSLWAATDHDMVYGNYGAVPVFEVISSVTPVTYTYPNSTVLGDPSLGAQYMTTPDSLYKCTRVY